MKKYKLILIIPILTFLFLVTTNISAQNINSGWFSISFKGGISILSPKYNDNFFGTIRNSISIERQEILLNFRIHKRHEISIIVDRDKYNYKYDVTESPFIYPPKILYTTIKQEYITCFGLSYKYKFYGIKDWELWIGSKFAGNDEYSQINLFIGSYRFLIKDLSVNFDLRYGMLFHPAWDKKISSQIGINYGLTYFF